MPYANLPEILKTMLFGSKLKKKALWVQTALERYERPLLQYALSIVQDIDRARDIVQDTFMRLHNQEQEAIEGHLSQWLFTVCRNCSLKSLKKEDRYIYVESSEFEQKKCDGLTLPRYCARKILNTRSACTSWRQNVFAAAAS